MLNIIWAGMVLVGIVYGIISGNVSELSDSFITSAKEAVSICITMVGVLGFWSGIMEIGKKSGVSGKLTKVMTPAIKKLFPRIPENHKAMEYISINIVANILGMGWAATMPGLKAMECLRELEEKRNPNRKLVASDEMCTLLIVNISSLQLIPMSIIAYRSEYGSANPAGVVFPGIIATTISTISGILFCIFIRKIAQK